MKKKDFYLLLLLFTPTIAYIVAQLIFGNFSAIFIDIAVLIVLGYIIYININTLKNTKISENTKDFKENKSIDDPDKVNNVEINHYYDKKHEFKYRLPSKFVSLVFSILMLLGSYLCYHFMSKTDISDATVVTADIIKIEDVSEVYYEEDSDGDTERSEHFMCKVTFSFMLNDKVINTTHTFDNFNKIKNKKIDIYVYEHSGEFIATYNYVNCGKIFAIYFIILAILNFISIFFYSEIICVIIGSVFASTFAVFISSIQISFIQIFNMDFGAIIVCLASIGVLFLFLNVGQGISIKINPNKERTPLVRKI